MSEQLSPWGEAPTAHWKALAAGQRSIVHEVNLDGELTTVASSDRFRWEAPHPGEHSDDLILNAEGKLCILDRLTRETLPITLPGVPDINNDHVMSPDGTSIFVSANDFQIYRFEFRTGTASRLTERHGREGILHFLHGVSPDGQELAIVGIAAASDWRARPGSIYTFDIPSSRYRRLTSGEGSADGCEYSPDGDWIYFNTEQFDGHAQLARMRRDGSEVRQLTFDDRVNWFPHISPDGTHIAYLSYPPGTTGHPADLPVELRLLSPAAPRDIRTLVHFTGGQGSINVNSWSRRGEKIAFVSYPGMNDRFGV